METTEFKWDDDEFDDTFYLEVDKLEEIATSLTQQPPPPSISATSYRPSPRQPPPPIRQPFISNNHNNSSSISNICYSPPRQLSQRVPTHIDNNFIAKRPPDAEGSLEIERLKSELSHVSTQLADLKDECSELRKERHKKELLKSVYSNKEASACSRNPEAHVLGHPHNGISLGFESSNAIGSHAASQIEIEQKSIGIQTDRGDESSSASISGATSSYCHNPKLLSIWSSWSSHRSKRNFVAKLLETCATDLCLLFGLDPNMTSEMKKICSTHVALSGNMRGLHSTEVARLSQLYSVLTKLSNDMVHVDALVDILLGLCSLENALVVRRSLRILHVALEQVLSMDRARCKRDNVKVGRCQSRSDGVDIHDSGMGRNGGICDNNGDETSSLSYISARKNASAEEHQPVSLLCHIDWLQLFECIRQIAIRLKEENVRIEAVSIMNMILIGTNAYSEREKFGGTLVFEAVAFLLRKEAGLVLQKEALHLLFLLLNCPSILAKFCFSCKDEESRTQSPNDAAKSLAVQVSNVVLEGLADCIIRSEYGAKELNLCRNAINVLAFLTSSGKSGLEIFLFHKLSKGANFLGLVLQLLVSEIDAEASESCSAPDLSKERTLLFRESLILLNRLASLPAHSTTVLQVLTSCRDTVSMAIDIVTRLSKKSRRLLKSDSITRKMRESEVVDLALVFKKRVYTFLGESISS